MGNERKTERLVRNFLSEQGYANNDNVIIEEQASDNPRIDKLLKQASKTGKGKGYPEFIITFKNQPQNIIAVECKASVAKHESKERNDFKNYAVDGALLYASYLKDGFNVIAIAVSGETEREVRVSHFLWLQGKHTYKDISDKNFLDPASLFKIVEKQSQPLREEELVKKAIEYNELLHSYSIPEVERCTVISSILVALQDQGFANSFNTYHDDNNPEDYNPNDDLIKALLSACETVLKRNKIDAEKQEVILREYGKIKSNHKLQNRVITVARKDERNTVLRDLILDVMTSIMPYIENNVYDILGKFYTQFIRYAGSDSKTGLVLTPPHITDLFCDLAEINENDIVLDPCCGTGGFLVSAMKVMIAKAGNDLQKHKRIKSEQLVGIEQRPDMFSHACSNMMMRGDGKSHIHFGDCFSSENIAIAKAAKPTKALLNPPYDVGEVGQLEFVENSLECLEKGGICVAICQMSVAVSAKSNVVDVRMRILEKHRLEAVLSVPDDLFYPVGVVTCILVFKAKEPHSSSKKTFFGYFRDDGFIKQKHQGRIDPKNQWNEIRSDWTSAYWNKESIPGLSVVKHVSGSDEWCAEAYMDTDYSIVTKQVFENTVKEFAVYQITTGPKDG
ncbi:MAG: N-6 DNA methylase [Pseudomonadota bacterium]